MQCIASKLNDRISNIERVNQNHEEQFECLLTAVRNLEIKISNINKSNHHSVSPSNSENSKYRNSLDKSVSKSYLNQNKHVRFHWENKPTNTKSKYNKSSYNKSSLSDNAEAKLDGKKSILIIGSSNTRNLDKVIKKH